MEAPKFAAGDEVWHDRKYGLGVVKARTAPGMFQAQGYWVEFEDGIHRVEEFELAAPPATCADDAVIRDAKVAVLREAADNIYANTRDSLSGRTDDLTDLSNILLGVGATIRGLRAKADRIESGEAA